MALLIGEEVKTQQTEEEYFKSKFLYEVGDAEGYHQPTCRFSIENPYIEKVIDILNKCYELPKRRGFGICISYQEFDCWKNAKYITEDECNFMQRVIYDYDPESINDKYSDEIRNGFKSNLPGNMGRYLMLQKVVMRYFRNGREFLVHNGYNAWETEKNK